MLASGFAHARDDFDARRAADLGAEIGMIVRATERGLTSAGPALDRESRLDIDDVLAKARAALDAKADARQLQKIRDELEQATLPLAALLMDGVAKAALAGKRLDEV
jgi:hypothetical protein